MGAGRDLSTAQTRLWSRDWLGVWIGNIDIG